MEDLKNFNIHDLFRLISKSDEEFLEWLRERKLIWTTRFCECGKEMSQVYKNDRHLRFLILLFFIQFNLYVNPKNFKNKNYDSTELIDVEKEKGRRKRLTIV